MLVPQILSELRINFSTEDSCLLVRVKWAFASVRLCFSSAATSDSSEEPRDLHRLSSFRKEYLPANVFACSLDPKEERDSLSLGPFSIAHKQEGSLIATPLISQI